MQNLGLTEEDFNRVSDIEQIFQTSENLKDHRFGEIALLTSEQNPNVIIMRKEKFSQDENECCKDILEAKQRLKMEHPCILQMPDFSTKLVQREQGFQEMLVSGYYEYPDWDLEREIEKRIQDKNYFQPDVLLKITFEILSAMSYLQSKKIIHGDLRPKYISFSNDMEFSYQLCDRLGDPYPPNKVQINNLKKNKPLYLSPILFKSLSLRKKRIRHNPYKSEVFSLGIIILEAGILENVQKIYDKKQKQIDVEIMLNYIEMFMNRYGEHDILRESLIWMLDLNGHNRKDPKTIYQMIQDYLEQMNGQVDNEQEEEEELDLQTDQQQSQNIIEQNEIQIDENIQTENLQYEKINQNQVSDEQNDDQNENSFDRIRKQRKFDINEEEYENLNIDSKEDQHQSLNQDQNQLQYEQQDKNEQFDFNKVPVLDSFDLRNSQQDQMKIKLNLEVKHEGDPEYQKDEEDRIEWKNDNKYYQEQQNEQIQNQQQNQEKDLYKRDQETFNKVNEQDIDNELFQQKKDQQKTFQKHLLSNFDDVNATSQLQTQNSRELSESKINQEFKQQELEKLYNDQQEQKKQSFQNQQREVLNYDQRNNFKDDNLHLYQNLNQNYSKNQNLQQINEGQRISYQSNVQNNNNIQNPVLKQTKQYTTTEIYKPQEFHQYNYQNNNHQQQQYNQNITQNSYTTQNNNLTYTNQQQTQTPVVSQQTSYINNNRNQYSMNKDLMKFTDNSIPNSQQMIRNEFEPQQMNISQTQPLNQIDVINQAPLSIQINQNYEQKNIYNNRDSKQIIEKPKRRTIKAKSIYPFNDPRYSSQSQREHRTNNSNSIKREYYVSPTRIREFKESISREPRKQSVTNHTIDYEVKKEGTKNVRRVILSRNNDSIFKNIVDGNYPEVNSIYNQPKLEEDWKERYGSNIEIVQQKKNYQVFRLSHSNKQNVQQNSNQNNFQFNQFNKMKFSGWIEYNGKKTPSEIKIDQHTEDSFYTEGSDDTGNFTMTAQISSSGRIDIKKQYNGKHLVLMFGRVTKNEDFINEFHGCWEIKNSATGDFEYKLLNQL